jgi:HPt (histidine-containing phosphotransfer) domain-containing protein
MGNSANEKIRIRADRDLEDLVPGFLANRRRDIETIRNHLVSGDYSVIERLGHAMKGSGGGYGFDEVTRLGMLIEKFAKVNDRVGIVEQLDALTHFLDLVEVVYD